MRGLSKEEGSVRTQLLAAGLSVAIGAMLLFATDPFWWAGAGLTLGGLVLAFCAGRSHLEQLRDRLSKPRQFWKFEVVPFEVLAGFGCLAVIVAVAAAILPEAALGQRPVDHDHTVHYFKARQLWEEFLTAGRLRGWSHAWFAGYPVGYHYPLGGDLWVCLIYALTLGLVDFGQAYAFGLFLLWVVSGGAVYAFARQGMGRAAALIAAVLYMGNTGSFRTGGWVFAGEWGVWPQNLAIALAVLAAARVPAVVETSRWRAIGLFALLMGAALMTHPMMIFFFAALGPMALLALWISRQKQPWLVGAGRLSAGYGLGVAIGGLWLFPFVANSSQSSSAVGALWSILHDQGTALYSLDLIPGTWGWVIALGFVGLVGLSWGRKFHHVLTGLLGLVFVLGGSTTFATEFHLFELFDSLRYVHLKRFVVLLKPFWFVAAGYAVVLVLTAAARGVGHLAGRGTGDEDDAEGSGAFRPWPTYGRAVALGFLVVPLLVPFFHEYGQKHLNRSLQPVHERPHFEARQQFVDWLEGEHDEGDGFFRVATDFDRHDHSFVDLGAEISYPIYKLGFTPTTSFVHKMEDADPELLRAVNARYVLSTRSKSGPFEEVERFGRLRVYEFEDWSPEPFEVIEGEGEVELVEFSDEEIVLNAGPEAEGTLRLNVTHYPNWRASRDGASVPIEKLSIVDEKQTAFITVPLEEGTYRFEFRARGVEWLSWILFLIAFLLAITLLVVETEFRLASRVRSWLEAAQERLEALAARIETRGVVVAGGLFAAMLAVAIWKPVATPDSQQPAAPVDTVYYDFGDNLRDATIGEVGGSDIDLCRQVADYFVCDPNKDWQNVYVRARDFSGDEIYRCIWAHPRKGEAMQLHFPDVPLGDAIIGLYGVSESGKRRGSPPVDLSIGIDGREVHRTRTERDGRVHLLEAPLDEIGAEGRIDVDFTIEAEDSGRRHFCFNAQMVDYDE